jgi:hypothetical protein
MLLVGLTQSATDPPPTDGPPGSSYATHSAGTAALADLLEANGYEVARVRISLGARPPDKDDVVVIINGGALQAEDVDAMRQHVTGGGRLVTGGSTVLDGIVMSPPSGLTATSAGSRATLPVGGFAAVQDVSNGSAWEDAGSLLPLVGNEDGTMLGIESVGAGTVVALADESVLANGTLDRGDHAVLALLAVGETDGTVRFIEYIHGFTQPTGLAALPTRWKQALLVLALAGVVWLVAHGRRFGPAEDDSRGLAPPRAAYLDAVAATLEASGDPDAAAPLTTAIETELARRGADLGSSADLVEVAVGAGADRTVVEQALGSGTRHDDVRARAILLSHLVNKEQL